MTEPTDALDSCPFCGNTNAIVYDDLLTFHVGCLSCGATGSASSYRNGAIAAWNRRTPQAPQAQAGAVPLTDEEVLDAFCRTPGIYQFVQAFPAGVRFAEQHHGIKGGQHGAE